LVGTNAIFAALYGTVGTWPAFSCASRAALSPASWVGSSLGTKLPVEELEPDDGVGDGDAADAAMVVAYSAAPPTPPMSIEPATTPAATNFRALSTIFMASCFDVRHVSVEA